jgi:c-di-GMP-binding flagellar brake protein YcgR
MDESGEHTALLLDLSQGGMQLMSNSRIEPQRTFTVEVVQNPKLRFRAACRWSRIGEAPDAFECGFEFVDIEPQVLRKLVELSMTFGDLPRNVG